MECKVLRNGVFIVDPETGKSKQLAIGDVYEFTDKQAKGLVNKIAPVSNDVADVVKSEPTMSSFDRIELIVEAIKSLDKKKDFNKSGVPYVKAIESVVGFDIVTEERDTAMESILSGNE